MYFNSDLFVRAQYHAFRNGQMRLRYCLYVVFFTALFGVVWLIVALGRMLDHIFFPAFRHQVVRQPVFIIAPPRSGTTLTQKLLSLDDERFVHAKLYQTIFPCVCYQRLLQGVATLDRRCGGPLRKLMAWAESRWFGGWDDMHKLRFNQPEEDDGFFVYTFATEAVYLLFPFVDELWEAGFADALPAPQRRRLMDYYRSCLQRQLYANGPNRTILSKATQFCGTMQCLLEAFPDARFITIVRHPYESVPSHVSVFYPVWHAHSPRLTRNSATSAAYARLAVEWYRHLHQVCATLDPARYYCVDYRDLVRNPTGVIEQIYAHFGFQLTDHFRRRLATATCREQRFKSEHHYTLEEFGLTREWIRHQLRDVLNAYSLEW